MYDSAVNLYCSVNPALQKAELPAAARSLFNTE